MALAEETSLMAPSPSAPGASTRTDDREWLSLGPASSAIGVDPDTLRRWADEGRLPTFTTPGGHRRFDRRDLERVMLTRRPVPPRRPLAALGATPDRLSRAYARSYRAQADGRSRVGEQFAAPDRAAFRADGQRLLSALLGYLDASGARRSDWEAQAATAVRATGVRLARHGASVQEATSTFIAARRPFLGELATLGRRGTLDVAALTTLYDDAVALLDRLLLELLDAFAQVHSKPQGEPR
ncbi:MAG TPA: helix-turn-helix domain-containing protein [Candidatus Binatus sp.]|nr:helix-turn-helix domain-containing protein [Candidatus Binatus sp.]